MAELRAALGRLVAGAASDQDRRAMHDAWLAGQLVLASGERSVAVAGDVHGLINTGDIGIQILLQGVEAEAPGRRG